MGKPGIRRVQKVALSSIVATLVDILSLAALQYVGVFVTVAAFFAALLGGVTNFLLNKYWAFEDSTPFRVQQVAAYALVSIVNAFIVAGLVHVFAVVLNQHWLLAKGVAAVIAFVIWSYPAQAKFVFSAKPEANQAPQQHENSDAI